MKMENYKNKNENFSEYDSDYIDIIAVVLIGLLFGGIFVCGIIGAVQTFC